MRLRASARLTWTSGAMGCRMGGNGTRFSTRRQGSVGPRGAQRAARRDAAAMGALSQLSFVPLLLVGLAFMDAPLQTFGQRWRSVRWGPRNVVIAVEVSLYALWALARFRFHLDTPLVASRLEPAVAD